MPHIDLPEGVPGIRSLLEYRPETAGPLLQLAEQLLQRENSLSRGERELVAAYVSNRNDCEFCDLTHSAFAAVQLDDAFDLVAAVKADPASAPISDKLKALLVIAGQVQQGGQSVTKEAVDAAKAEGATDVEVHDVVLIAAAFCMYNRYVDGLATWSPATTAEAYLPRARELAAHGYLARPTYEGYTQDG